MTTAFKHLIKTCKLGLSNGSKMSSAAVSDRKMKMSKSGSKMQLKTAKGTRDFHPIQMVIRKQIMSKIIAIFERHGARTIETPAFESKEILTGKYGEESKLIYDLDNAGNEALSLRYDLTVPFARYLAMNKVTDIRRYQIAKVYRRDNPSIARGRYRQFYQCDFDIAGAYDSMIPDAECVRVIYEIFEAVRIGEYTIKVNHRRLLDGIFEYCGVQSSHFKSICSSIDKLDKETWETVRNEIINDKHLNEDVANKIGEFVTKKGSLPEMIEYLEKNSDLLNVELFREGLNEMKVFFEYICLYGVPSEVVVFDLSLARGLDYYTGLIFETILIQEKMENGSVENDDDDEKRGKIGSVAGGGRYDNLVSSLGSGNENTPCVGLSIGIERIFAAVEASQTSSTRTIATEVYVISAQKHLVEERMKLCTLLWDNDFKAEHSYKSNPKFLSQLQYCEENAIPFAIIIGTDEIKQNVVKLRDIPKRVDVEIKREDLIERLRSLLSNDN